MTDAREIIRIAAEDKMRFDGFSSYDEMARHLIQALTTAGYRILGPDEVDPVAGGGAQESRNRNVSVKPLEWTTIVPGRHYVATKGDYAVTTDGNRWAFHPRDWPPFGGYPYDTAEAAKAAVQEDHEREVLSCLDL